MVIVKGVAIGFALVIALFVGLFIPVTRTVADWLLTPGYALPVAYWGAAHDPLQILAAILLNIAFYSFLATCWILFRARAK